MAGSATTTVMWIFTGILLIAILAMAWLMLFSAIKGSDSKLVKWMTFGKTEPNVTELRIWKPLAFALPITAIVSMLVLIITGAASKKTREGFKRMML